MVKVDLKGLHVCRKKSGTYYYAWRGGPRVKGEPGTLEFIENFHAAIEQARAPDTSKFRSLIAAYKASQDYQELAASTKRNWSPWLDKIADYFGDLGIVHFNNPERIRPAIRKWRGRYADKPRTADYGLQVLSRVLAYGVDPLGKIVSNPCEGIKNIYSADRAEIIWTDADLAEFHAKSSPEVSWAVELAAHTGLRRSDLFKLSWSHVGEHGIVMKTGKSGQRRQAVVPLYRALREVLAQDPAALAGHPDEQQGAAVDAERLRKLLQRHQAQGLAGGHGATLSRPSRHRGDQVLCGRTDGARDRGIDGLGGGDGLENYPPLRRARGGFDGPDSASR